ncbi:tetratricopeptide repeat protein [Oscillatoria sp. CS-180]|uniref:tetratricopeptide repeat protein n=1 Tax=Oscillatoria sp. CS-180 TaxID=3021720 RepID=UPI0023301348|nr:tetratricopeptide repeat protein [Oscillatoria sp. CS-180]MDB9526554.1 tetratricopeptide repeat protein [Oscillatoria sp. CS-180]
MLDQGHYEAALDCLSQAPQSAHNSDNLVNQAVCLIHLSRSEEALQVCDRALTFTPNHAQAWLFKGVAFHRLGRHKDAYACYSKALERARLEDCPPKPERLDGPPPTINAGSDRFQFLRSLVKHVRNNRLLRSWVQ